MTAGVPPRVEAGTKAALLDLVDGAVGEGWTTARACSVLELDNRRCQRDETRQLIATAEADGRFRLADNHRQVHDNLNRLIAALEDTGDTTP